jgi:hypothetical protein
MPQRVNLDDKWKLVYFPEGKFRIKNPDDLSKINLTFANSKFKKSGNVRLIRLSKIAECITQFLQG